MKKISILLVLIILTSKLSYSQINTFQTVCYIQYSYDPAGNRINRIYECGANPLYNGDPDIDPGNGGGLGNARYSQINTKDSIVIFPNPTKGVFKIRLPKQSKNGLLEIRDLYGSLLKRQLLFENETTIDISSFANGEYVINIFQGDKSEVANLIKQN